MHKITKGLKKKKKGKKSKRGEEDLFKPEELENYRREHQGTSEEPVAQNEEWRKFIALTSEVDDILKKTQGDLNRIKSTSFFQRKPTESEVKKVEEEHQKEVKEQRKAEETKNEEPPKPTGIVEISESETEEEEDDTVFDTAYIDAIATGEVKLAYIPESPTEQQGDDPFDTSYADRAILGPEVERKGRKLVPLGAAVEVLTGRVQLPTCATKRPSPKRRVLKERNLLLGSFDETTNLEAEGTDTATEEVKKTLLDEDPIPLPDEPIDLSKPIIPPQLQRPVTSVEQSRNALVSEFEEQLKDEEDLEFEELAAESLAKGSSNVVQNLNIGFAVQSDQWNAKFDTSLNEETEDDPFDTTFAEPILPDGKLAKIAPVNNLLINEDRIPQQELNLIKPIDRDLLGGSNVDLSISGRIAQTVPIEAVDPFEIIDTKITADDLDDEDFDPRAVEKPRERTVSRPDVLNIVGSKTVSFDVPSPESLLKAESSRVIKPLTPFYTRKNSVPELPDAEDDDPFDTSFAVNLAPGKAELKVIESELFDPNIEKSFSLEDKNFDPRDERRAKIDRVLNSVNEVAEPKVESLTRSVDLLDIDNDISAKVLTPADFVDGNEVEELSYKDPFDTSAISTNILPGKTELKLLESELIHSNPSQVQSGKRKQCVDNLLLEGDDLVVEQPLNPVGGFPVESVEDFDPFDTSGVENIQPGPVELKILASEFVKN